MKSWKEGDRLRHRLNPELGAGRVESVEGRTLVVSFPEAQTTLRFARTSEGLEPLELRPGLQVRLASTGEVATIEETPSGGRLVLDDGREVDEGEVWPVDLGDELLDRLVAGEVSSLEALRLRLDTLRLVELREADGLGSFLGGRIHLFPHQLYVAERAARSDPVRWLLADEVGLGKTVEACLILNHLLHTGRAERVLVVAPESLTVQWLGELWRKYHRTFVLLDDQRLADVARDFGGDFSPFDVHRQAVVSEEKLAATRRLQEQAVEAEIDLLVVDEAHRLRRRPGHPGNAAYRAVAPIAELGRHALLLTAVPLEDDLHGFFRLLQLLRPEDFPSAESFREHLASGRGLPPCTSATRRSDIGGLPPRLPAPVDLPDGAAFEAWNARVERERRRPAANAVELRDKGWSIRRALASIGAGGEAEEPLDPRVEWLVARSSEWQAAGEKTLVFVAERDTLEQLRAVLGRRLPQRLGVFHEDLSVKQRDIEAAQFRLPGGPALLLSTECGGEGRNFEFCTRLVLFDLPFSPMTVEQRIGRLDRIGRRTPVEIVYFRPPRGLGLTVARLYERLGLFECPLTSIETELRKIEPALEDHAARSAEESARFDDERFEELLAEARQARDRVEQAAYHELHAAPYCTEMAADVLGRIPAGLEGLTRDVVVAACAELGLVVEEHDAGRRHWIELDARARIESLPGIPGEASFLGTFLREEAVRDETLDFFAFGHPVVEGILGHLADAALGRVALVDLADGEGRPGFGLFAAYEGRRGGPGYETVALDERGRERPEWCERLLERPLRARRVRRRDWVDRPGWPEAIRSLGRHLEGRGRPIVLAAVRASSDAKARRARRRDGGGFR